jgi:hypothetical protein
MASGQSVLDLTGAAGGGVCIGGMDEAGDINLDGFGYNIGDAALFTRYFIYGSVVWDPVWHDVQELETDFNDDGIIVTVDDFRFLVKVLAGTPFYSGTGDPCWGP